MPRYDYRCNGCGNVYEKREGFDAPPVQACPDCNGEARRLLTPPAIVFKGSGWYVNDSRKGSASTDASSTSESKDGEGAKKTEAKGEAKAEQPAKDGKADAAKPAKDGKADIAKPAAESKRDSAKAAAPASAD